MAQFYGHTHNDEYVVFYDQEDPARATGCTIKIMTHSYTSLIFVLLIKNDLSDV